MNSQPYLVFIGAAPTSTWSRSFLFGSIACSSTFLSHLSQKSLLQNSSILYASAIAILAGGSSVWNEKTAVILPFILSGKSAIAFALKEVTKCLACTFLRSLEIATTTFMPSGPGGYFESAV